jgi:hypothetical protein
VTKICKKCKTEKPLDDFYTNVTCVDGKEGSCKRCRNKNSSNNYKSKRKYYANIRKRWYQKNKSWYLKYCLTKQKQPDIQARRNAWSRNKYALNPQYKNRKLQYKKQNPEKWKQYNRQYAKKQRQNPTFRLSSNVSRAIRSGLRGNKHGQHWEALVSYTLAELKEHLESRFQPGMSWDNYGQWHIDHIIPQSFFIFTSYSDDAFKACWCLKNLQPLWAKDNLIKKNKLINPIRQSLPTLL